MTDLDIAKPYKPLWWWVNHTTPPYRYYALEGGRASGKSTAVADSLVCRGSAQPIRVLCAREYQNSINDSVHRLLADRINTLGLPGYTITKDTIEHANGTIFIFRGLHNNLQSIKSIEGINVAWVEEAQTVSRESLDILLPTVRAENSVIILTWNPLTNTDPVMERFVTKASPAMQAMTYHAHTTYRTIRRKLSQDVLDMVLTDLHTEDYQHIWEGQPYAKTINQIISFQQLDEATRRPQDTNGGVTFGVDIARYGEDRTALAIKQGSTITRLIDWRHASITETANRIATYAEEYKPLSINLDDTGVGGGVTDILSDHRLPVRGINYAAQAKQPNLYPNVASELWFDFASQLPKLSINPRLENLSDLIQELSTREWKINARNQRQVQSKGDYKNQNETGSPDLADAVLLCCYQPAIMPSWDVSI